MKLFAVLCCALFIAVEGKRFEFKCIRLDINGTVTVSGKNTKTNTTLKDAVIDLSTVTPKSVSGDCSKASPVKMTVAFDNTTSWELTFNNANGKVTMDQGVTFDPAVTFNLTDVKGPVTVSSGQSLPLSSSNKSFECDSPLHLALTPKVKGNYSFAVTQDVSFFKVQAFGLPNTSYSPADHCSDDKTTTVAPITTPPPVPSAKPVTAVDFALKDAMKVACFRLHAGLQFAVEYEDTNKAMVYSKVMTVPKSVNVSGSCAGRSASTAVMTLTSADPTFTLTFTETLSGKTVTSSVSLSVKLDPVNFPNAAQANQTLTFSKTEVFEANPSTTFYVCSSLLASSLTGTKGASYLYTNDLKLQTFGLVNGSFTGDGMRCAVDPTPSPLPPASKPGDNTYSVKQNATVTCIVLKGEISFSNVTYAVKGGRATANPISIPAMNETTGNVNFTGSCSLENGTAQQLVITFNGNWTLTLTFARGSKSSSMLTDSKGSEFSLRDIELVYFQTPQFFPNATDQGLKVVSIQKNISSDFMQGTVGGGSWKCEAEQRESLSNGVQFVTTNLQYKAFNKDNSTSFGNDVKECPADDQSNSIVPIAVGAALAGLVVVVLVAYLIGRRRSRRQGYESV